MFFPVELQATWASSGADALRLIYGQLSSGNSNLYIGPHTDGLCNLAKAVRAMSQRQRGGGQPAADDAGASSSQAAAGTSSQEAAADANDGASGEADDDVASGALVTLMSAFRLPPGAYSRRLH